MSSSANPIVVPPAGGGTRLPSDPWKNVKTQIPEGPWQAQAAGLWGQWQGLQWHLSDQGARLPRECPPSLRTGCLIPSHPHPCSALCQENSGEAPAEAASESPMPTLARSTSSDTSEELNSQDSPKKEDTAASSTSSSSDPVLDFNISLAVAKERAHQKRSSKRAPQMDWSKKNELFSNL